MPFDDDLSDQLARLQRRGLRRQPLSFDGPERARSTLDGRPVVIFCSNDYLGLGADPELASAAARGLERYGLGAGASRLISGTHEAHRATESVLASWVELPASLFFSSGYAANVGALSALLGRGDVAFSDRLNHASLIDGLRLSRAQVHVYDHGDTEHLRALLRAHRGSGRRALVVSDTLFSMDGDLADVTSLRALADTFDAGLYVDEAHALGVVGAGRGWCAESGVRPDVLVGTLGKAIGAMGAFVAGSHDLRALLENRARSYVFSTAPPPAITLAIREAVRRALTDHDARARAHRHAARIRATLQRRGWSVPDGDTLIIPILIGDAAETMRLSEALLARGYFVQGIRPPTVPEGTSRLRLVPTAAHTDAQVDGLLDVFATLIAPGSADDRRLAAAAE